MLIRDATEKDVPAIAELHAESWRSAYRGVLSDDYLEKDVHRDRLAVWQERFSNASQGSMFVIVAEMASTFLGGFACVFPEKDAIWGSFLDNLHVSPQLTGQGIGRKLLAESAGRLVRLGSSAGLYLWVIEQNYRARRFYEKAGAKVVDSAVNTMPDNRRVVALRCYWPDPGTLVL
jgi:ribosomal protein S18 acetylase RimI-like enzyme